MSEDTTKMGEDAADNETADSHDEHDEHDEHDDGHGEDRPDFDPHKIDLPSREPPLRSTAPQSEFASTQVVRGALVLAVGLALTFGVALVLA